MTDEMTVKYPQLASGPPAVAADVLPAASSPDLEIVPVTPLEYVHTWHLNAEEWRGPLSQKQYNDREEYLLSQELCKDGQITAWILTSRSLPRNPDGSRPILASCESLLKQAYVAHGGGLQEILAHGIASVYTRPEYRGRGYAGRMLKELGGTLKGWQRPREQRHFSVLFSDIGNAYYSRFGWKTFPSEHITLQAISSTDMVTSLRASLQLPEVKDLTAEDVRKIPGVTYLEQELRETSSAAPEKYFVAVSPDGKHFGWHHAREDIQCKILGLPYPNIKGAIHTESGIAVVWIRILANDPKDNQLVILRTIQPPSAKDIPAEERSRILAALLLRAQHEAGNWDMRNGVELWSPDTSVLGAAELLAGSELAAAPESKKLVEVISRDKEHVCCLQWDGDEHDEVVWIANERFEWC